MIGVSLPYDWLLTGEGVPGCDRNAFLTSLKNSGVESIEIRTVLYRHSPSDVLAVAERLWNFGFSITVHSHIRSGETAIYDMFSPLGEVLKNLRQEKLTLALHAITEDNVKILTELSDYSIKMGYPVYIALENNRLLPDNSEGDSAAFVLDTVKKVGRRNVGICFDMGHYMYYLKKNKPESSDVLPPREFIDRVIHLHIHALDGLKTHYPLDEYDLPLKELLEGVAWRYFGVYNFEPDFPRWCGRLDPEKSVLRSIPVLKDSLPLCARLYDKIRKEFDGSVYDALTVYKKTTKGTEFSLINATSYLFNTSGYRWAMDIAFRFANSLARTPKRCAELFSSVELMVVTHGHVDHFEEETVRALAKCNMTWVIPDFLVENALEWDISPDRMIVAHEGERIEVGKLTILPFRGRHFRPENGKGVEAFGYYITAEGSPSMVFPTDVRDYSLKGLPSFPDADYCFAHVFLGDGNAFASDYSVRARAFAEFMLHFSKKNIFLTHLYENGRKDIDMWRPEHADIISDMIHSINPEVKVIVPKWGESFKL